MNSEVATSDVRQHILDSAYLLMGRRGFTAVGLNELLTEAGVPKGSFYYYFNSKESFGEALLENYFSGYLEHMDALFVHGKGPAAQRLVSYWDHWLRTQATRDPEDKCLVVKLSGEVSDLSEPMRLVLLRGTQQIVHKIAECITQGVKDGSLKIESKASELANSLYQIWLGASLLAKITHDRKPLHAAMVQTRRLLNLKPSR